MNYSKLMTGFYKLYLFLTALSSSRGRLEVVGEGGREGVGDNPPIQVQSLATYTIYVGKKVEVSKCVGLLDTHIIRHFIKILKVCLQLGPHMA